jgi:shikimate kinase
MTAKQRIYLIGLPASGKTTIGRWLAERLGWEFYDIDEAVISKSGLSIFRFFEERGEEEFRKLETELLRETKLINNTVISCGGGTVAHSNNMEWILNQGLTVYLNPEISELSLRIAGNPTQRPMFKGLQGEEITVKLSNLLEERAKFYHQSKIIWNKSTPNDFLYKAVNQLVASN